MKITRLDPKTQEPTADIWSLSRDCRRLVIGRSAPAEIQFDSPDLSPRHAELSWQSGWTTLHDLASINGIFLRDARILRATLQDRDVFSVGGLSFRADVEPADLAARRTRQLCLLGILVGGILVALLVYAFFRDAQTAEPEAPPEEPTPILPAAADPAFQKLSDQYAEATDLLNESRRIIADGLDDLRAAQLLQQALALNTNLPQASLLLKGLQENHSAGIQQRIDSLVASGQFQNALDELERQNPLVGDPDAVRKTQDKINQRLQYQRALDALDQGDLDAAENDLAPLSPDIVPERQAALDRLARCRTAVAWAAELERLADQNDLPAVQRLADDEPRHAPYLSPEALGEVHGAIARARAMEDMKKLIAAGNTYILVQYLPDIPALSDMCQPLRDSLAPQARDLRQAADAEAAHATARPLPEDLKDALASYSAARAFASLYVIHPEPADLRQYRLHSERWNAYLATIASRARAYLDEGAREEARAILQPLLPHLDDYDPASYPLRNLSVQLTPIPFSPETARLLEKSNPSTSAGP